MNEHGRNETDIFRCLDVEYTPEGHSEVYRWDDFLKIAGGHVHSAMYLIDMVSAGGEYEGEEPEYAYACEIVGCCGLRDGVALFRPVSHDGANLIQIAFLRNDVDDATGAYTERFEAGSFGVPSDVLPCSEFGVDLLEYFNGRSLKYTPGVNRGLDAREAVNSIEDAIGCDLGLFDGFWLGVPGEADMRVGPYSKKSLLDFSYYAKELSCRYGFADSDILEIARHLPQECPDCLAAVKAYLDCEYVPDGNELDEKTYRWGDFLEIDSYDDVVNLLGAGEAAAMLADAAGNRFNRQDIMKAILNGGDIHLDYWPEYGEYDYAARICGELLADTSLAWADGLVDPDKIKTHKGLTTGDLSHAVTCVLTDRFNDGLDEARLADCKNIADEFARAIESRVGSGRLGRELYVDSGCLRDDLADKFGFSYDIDFSGLTFKTSLILSVNGLYSEGDVIDAASDWQEDCLPCVCHRGGQGEDDRWEYEPAEDYRPFTRPADIPESIFDKLCASQGTTIEKVVNDPVTPFERSFREDIFNMPQNRPVGLAVLATLPLDAFLDASLSMICRGEGENAGTFTVKPGTYEPIFGIYDPVGGCGGTMGTVLDRDFEIDPHDIAYTMMEPVRGEWKSDRIDLYTPQDCFGFSDPFGGRIEYSEKKPEIAVAVKPDPVELGHRASVAASSTAGDRARGAGIRQ